MSTNIICASGGSQGPGARRLAGSQNRAAAEPTANRAPPPPPKGAFAGTPGRNSKARESSRVVIDAAKRSGVLQQQRGTFCIAPLAPLRDKRLGRITPRDVLAALCGYRNATTGKCCPSHDRLAADLGIHRTTVQKHIKKLAKLGHILIEPRKRKGVGGWTSNQYHVPFRPVGGQENSSAAESEAEADPGAVRPDLHAHRLVLAVGSDAARHAATPRPIGRVIAAVAAHEAATVAAQSARTLQRAMLQEQIPNRSIEQTSAEAVARACEQPERALRARAETMTPIRLAKPVQPQPLRHPVDEAAQSLADRSGQQLGKVVADVLLWMDGLERAGYSGVEAEAAVLQEFEAIKDAGASGDPVARIDACIRARIEQRRSPTP
jgi:hypothetical protein